MDQLREAVESNDLESVKKLLPRFLNQLGDNDREYLLREAATDEERYKIFNELVRSYGGVPLNCATFVDNRGNTWLHHAARARKDEVVATLLKQDGIDAWAVNKKNETAAHVAARKGQITIVDALLERMMERTEEKTRNTVDKHGLSVFHLLCAAKNPRHVDSFLDRCEKPAAADALINGLRVSTYSEIFAGYTPLHFAVTYHRYETARMLVDRGADVNARTKDGFTPLLLTCTADPKHSVRYETWLVKEALGPTTMALNRETKIKCSESIKANFYESLKTLLYKRLYIFNMLLERGCDVIDDRDCSDESALMIAVQSHSIGYIEIRFNDFTNITGHLPPETVNFMLYYQFSIIATLLQRYNSDVRVDLHSRVVTNVKPLNPSLLTNNIGYTCLHKLAGSEITEKSLVNLLIELGTDVMARGMKLETCLHAAARSANCFFIHELLALDESKWGQMMVNVNAQDRRGNTPLYCVFKHLLDTVEVQCVRSLLNYGADPSITNNKDVSVLSLFKKFLKVNSSIFNKPQMFIGAIRNYNYTTNLRQDLNRIRSWRKEVKVSIAIWKYLKMTKTCSDSDDSTINDLLRVLDGCLLVTENNKTEAANFRVACEREINSIRNVRISETSRLHDVLVKHVDTVGAYTRNEELRRILESPDLMNRFPLYGRILRARFVRAVERRDVMQRAKVSLCSLIKRNIPELCLEMIFEYLNDNHLHYVAKANSDSKSDRFCSMFDSSDDDFS